LAANRRKVLCITLEPISQQMAGPAIRAVELGKQLSDQCDVTVFSPVAKAFTVDYPPSFSIVGDLSKQQVYELAQSHDILFIQANVLKPYPELARLDKYMVVDLYDPYLLSLLAQWKEEPVTAASSYKLMHQILEKHMASADFSVCASERQRDYWLGRYCGIGRLTPEMYEFDPSFRKMIDIVPFGLPSQPPVSSEPAIKGKVPGINSDDFVLLWGGGIWEWFDPLTVIQAVAKASKQNPRVKLFFMGWKSPNPQVPLMEMAIRSKKLAEELGVLNKQVFFHDGWVAYEDRINYLLDTDLAVSAHFDLPETRFSFRTRILDYLWAGLPVATTRGDELADLIAKQPAGEAIDYGDVDGWVNFIAKIANDPQLQQRYRDGSKALAQQFTWNKAAAKLKEFCANPYHSPRFERVKMPSLFERVHAVYTRGGADLVIQRSKNLIKDLIP
jgi:glycosyltransferase involved in cell wall biosynthesis